MALQSPFVLDVNEQATAGYWATLVDETGALVPSNILTTFTLLLYVQNADGTFTVINGRNRQNVLNANDVTVYPALQTRADGKTYNLFWQIRQGDTTIQNQALPTERHIALFEWSWPSNHFGKQEVVLAVHNLNEVP